MLDFSTLSDPAARVYTVDLNLTDPVRLANQLHQTGSPQRPHFLIDCRRLSCLRTRGVSYLVSQLLLTKKAGADVLLYNVGSVLARTLQLLKLHQVFPIVPAPKAM